MRQIRKITAAAGALAVAALGLVGCGNQPGDLVDDPLAVKLVDAETKMQQWSGVEMTMSFSGSGQLGGRSLPCMAITSKTKPAEIFSMDYIRSNDAGDQGCSGDEDSTTRVQYADNTIYVTDLGESGYGAMDCKVVTTSHQVSGELAQEFIDQQTKQAKLSDLMQAVTEISEDGSTISMTLDAETMAELGDTAIPSGGDVDDVDVTAEAELDGDGALSALTINVAAGDVGGIQIDVHYAQSDKTPEMPAKKCVQQGKPFSSASQLQAELA